MYTPAHIITMIQDDCPCTYDILHEETCGRICDGGYPVDWGGYFDSHPEVLRPTPEHLLEILSNYEGDNHDTHYWGGRYEQMKIINTALSFMMNHPFSKGSSEYQAGIHYAVSALFPKPTHE